VFIFGFSHSWLFSLVLRSILTFTSTMLLR
jgi:hypothetical protein